MQANIQKNITPKLTATVTVAQSVEGWSRDPGSRFDSQPDA